MDSLPLRSAAGSRAVSVVGDVYRFLATGEDTGGRYALLDAIVLPGGGPPPHLHSREQEGFYILEGEVTFSSGARKTVAKAGSFIDMPPGVPHAFKNESARPARMLIWVAPAGLEKLFLEHGSPLPPGATTAPPPTGAEIERILKAAADYGVEILP